MNKQWQIFKGTGEPHQGIEKLPEPPPWRCFGSEKDLVLPDGSFITKSREEIKGSTFEIGEREIELINAALYLRRPLLVTGNPGTGKSSLAYAIAYELQLGSVLKWSINTRTSLDNGLYRYDAIGRLQDVQIQQKQSSENQQEDIIDQKQNAKANYQTEIGRYIQLGALGTAFLPNNNPRVLLIDEIDKSDLDLPNDLLNIFEEGEYEIPELARISDRFATVTVRTIDNQQVVIERGQVTCTQFPLVILTSNGERDFPPAFLRRCLQLEMPPPKIDKLTKIVEAHFKSKPEVLEKAEKIIEEFVKRRDRGQNLATDQLLNVIFMLTENEIDEQKLLKHLLQPLDRVGGGASY